MNLHKVLISPRNTLDVADFSQFQTYYEEHMPKLYRYVFARTGGERQLAEDLVSEICLKALEHFSQYNSQYPFEAWLFGIARNHLIDHYKKTSRKQTTSINELENILPANENQNPQKEADRALHTEQLQIALKKLPPEKEELVTLRYLSGYSYREMAHILDKEENAVKVATFRAVQQLKQLLKMLSL